MRRRLRNFLPIVLLALMVQILAPIGACWAVSIAASDPLHAAIVCHDNGASTGQAGGAGQTDAHDGCCSLCNVLHTGVPVDVPDTAIATLYRQSGHVVWRDSAPDLFGSRAGFHAQARAPPSIS